MNIDIKSRNFFWAVLNLTMMVVLVLGLKLLFTGELSSNQERYITVSAEGEVIVVPDIAKLSFSVVSEGQNSDTIQKENNEKVSQAITFVKGEGVDDKDIKTAHYNISPRYNYNYKSETGEPQIIGYRMTQTVSVTVRDLEAVAGILGGLPELGINQIQGVSFDIDDPDSALNDAREEAFDKARDKAEIMAKQNGTSIKRVVTFSEGNGGYPIPYYAKAESFDSGVVAAQAPTIEAGSQEVTVNVSVTYELR